MDDTVATIFADDDGWFKLAVEDTAVVADVLLLLKHADPPPPPPRTSNRRNDCPALRLEWSVRQRRSRHVPRQQHDEAAKNRKKGDSSGGGGGGGGARASPTTPLSWSGGTSVSGGGCGGYEESSKPDKPTGAARSKLSVRSGTIISKRPRKKKTVAEFKEVETLLLKERKALKNELATLRFTVDKQRATNESLKRMKLHLQFTQTTMKATNSPVSSAAIWHQHAQVIAVGHPTTINATNAHCNDVGTSQSSCQPNISCKVQEIRSRDTAFSLPDLNIPFGEDPSSEVLEGLS